MINHILVSLSVNETNADFTSQMCVAVPLCPNCQNAHYFADLQRPHRCYEPVVRSKNLLNQCAAIFYTNSVRLENRVIYH